LKESEKPPASADTSVEASLAASVL
jgi:hypothetical protein